MEVEMAETTHANDVLLEAARAAAEAFLAVLGTAGSTRDRSAVDQSSLNGPIEFDPLTDPVPLPHDPGPGAGSSEQKMAHLAYLGAVARINASEGRGATSREVAKYAKKAGYFDGKAVNGWNSRPGSARAITNIDGARYLNRQGHEWVSELATELGVVIRGDVTPLPVPSASP